MGCLTSPKITDPAEQIRQLNNLRNRRTNKAIIKRSSAKSIFI